MQKYYLASQNIVNGSQKIILEKSNLLDMDKYIYNFDSEASLNEYYGVDENHYLNIMYVYKKMYKYLDLITRKKTNDDFKGILDHTENNLVVYGFSNFMNKFFREFNQTQLEYLYRYGYINSMVYYDLLAYIGIPYYHAGDEQNIIYKVKMILQRYINFRKLYIGLYNYEHHIYPSIPQKQEKKLVSTDNELVNSSYNNGGLDEVYSIFDLDDLKRIDGIDDLKIDGIKRLEKR